MSEWSELLMGSCKAFFLQMQPDFVAHLKLVWYSCGGGEAIPVFFHDRIPLLLLLRGGTLREGHGCVMIFLFFWERTRQKMNFLV